MDLSIRPSFSTSLSSDSTLSKISFGVSEIFEAAEVAPIERVGAEGRDFLAGGCEAEISVDDRENPGFSHEREQARREDVDSGEGARPKRRETPSFARNYGILRIRDKCVDVVDAAAGEVSAVVEEELAGGFAFLDGKCGENGAFLVGCKHLVQIDGA